MNAWALKDKKSGKLVYNAFETETKALLAAGGYANLYRPVRIKITEIKPKKNNNMYYSISHSSLDNEELRPWDCEGNPVKRTKDEYPYSYSNHLRWVKDDDVCYITEMPKDVSVVYSDRLWSWDHKKYDECCEKIWGDFGQYFSNRAPHDIEKFLSLYFNCPIELLKIGEECNQSSGYPLWVFWYRQIKEEVKNETSSN